MKQPTPKFTAIVKDGDFEIEQAQAYKLYMRGLEGKKVDLCVSIHRKGISTPQIRYYYGVIISILGDYFGYSKDEMDLALKEKFLAERDSNGFLIIPSKTEKRTDEAEEFFEQIRRWAMNEYQIYIPLPNEVELVNSCS